MESKDFNPEKEEITQVDIEKSLGTLTEQGWKMADWPLISVVSKEAASQRNEKSPNMYPFWKEVFNPKNFIYPNSQASFVEEDHLLCVLHSFSKPGAKDVVFKAIITRPESLLKNTGYMINYKFHGKPCENRSRGVSFYPTCSDFWKDFHDKLPEEQKDDFPMPSTPWRKKFILEKYFGKK
jgi:hypothetical protein